MNKMAINTLYCFERPDPYAIITSIYYVLFGLLGLLVNNSFLNDVNSYLLLTGLGAMIEFFGVTNEFHYVPLSICSGTICYKLLAELVKLWSGETIDETDMVMGISGEKFYRLPVSFISLTTSAYICIAILYYNIFLTISLLIVTQITAMIVTLKFFPKGTEHYANTRTMLFKSGIGILIGCIGLGTSLICPKDKWIWIRLFIGHPIANICLPYSLYISAQLILLLRGRNLSRRIAIRGNNFIFIAYYAGRFHQPNKAEHNA